MSIGGFNSGYLLGYFLGTLILGFIIILFYVLIGLRSRSLSQSLKKRSLWAIVGAIFILNLIFYGMRKSSNEYPGIDTSALILRINMIKLCKENFDTLNPNEEKNILCSCIVDNMMNQYSMLELEKLANNLDRTEFINLLHYEEAKCRH
jgi:hypothetical protein